jgi:hypothetical protein
MTGRRITPSMVVAALALFAALGGSAFAVGSQSAKLGCTPGAAKAFITFDYDHVVGSVPQSFSNSAKLFSRKYTCNGKAPELRGTAGAIEVRFPGLPPGAAIATPVTANGGTSSVTVSVDGVYRVVTYDPSGNSATRGFTLVVF